jgi:NADH-quinone oxidoreductase subunit K
MVYNYKNFLVTMMCVEIMYLGAVTSFVLYGLIFHDQMAAIYGLLVLIFAACESALGLGLLLSIYRFGRRVNFDAHTTLGVMGPVSIAVVTFVLVIGLGCAVCAFGYLVCTSTRTPVPPDPLVVAIEPQLREFAAGYAEIGPCIHSRAVASLARLREARLAEVEAGGLLLVERPVSLSRCQLKVPSSGQTNTTRRS